MGEGYDQPNISIVSLFTDIASLPKLGQIMGRASRIFTSDFLGAQIYAQLKEDRNKSDSVAHLISCHARGKNVTLNWLNIAEKFVPEEILEFDEADETKDGESDDDEPEVWLSS